MDFNLLRLKNLFQPTTPFEPVATPPMGTPPLVQPEQDFSTRLKQIYTPETRATEQFNQLSNQFPTRENPSIMRKIGAALLNVGGQDGQAFLDEPFNRQLTDWKTKMEPAYQAANLERYANANERQLAGNILSNEATNRRLDLTESRNDVLRQQGQARIDATNKRNQIMEFKANNPNHVFKTDDEGMLIAINPTTRETYNLGINTGDLSDVDKANLQLDKNLILEDVRQGNRIGLENTRENNRRGRANSTGNIPTQERVRIVNRANAALREHPEWGDFITVDGNDVSIAPPSTGRWFSSGPDKATYDAIVQYIDQTTPKTEVPKVETPPKTDVTNAAPPPIAQRTKGMKFTFPNGNIGEWDGTKWIPIKVN